MIENEVKEQFYKHIDAINKLDIKAWAGNYSETGFLSALCGMNYFNNRKDWIAFITQHFSMRESQTLDPTKIKITPIATDTILLTSEEKAEMKLKDGMKFKSQHIFTIIWKKESGTWKIIHSHESWNDEEIK